MENNTEKKKYKLPYKFLFIAFIIFTILITLMVIIIIYQKGFIREADKENTLLKAMNTTYLEKLTLCESQLKKDKHVVYDPPEFPGTIFDVEGYTNCRVYQRSSMNFPADDDTLDDRSEVRCDNNLPYKVLFEIQDKQGFENSKNNVYRFWKDSEGYKALVVDQNGAGSGEGYGKIILLENNDYKLLSCFYYTPELFVIHDIHEYGIPISEEEMVKISENAIDLNNTYCNNFSVVSNIN